MPASVLEKDFNADGDANTSEWSRKTAVNYLGTKIQAQITQSEHYS